MLSRLSVSLLTECLKTRLGTNHSSERDGNAGRLYWDFEHRASDFNFLTGTVVLVDNSFDANIDFSVKSQPESRREDSEQ